MFITYNGGNLVVRVLFHEDRACDSKSYKIREKILDKTERDNIDVRVFGSGGIVEFKFVDDNELET